MRIVTADEWADHVSNFRTYSTESRFSGGVSWLNSLVSENPPNKPWPQKAPAGALVGRVEYRPDGSKQYQIF